MANKDVEKKEKVKKTPTKTDTKKTGTKTGAKKATTKTNTVKKTASKSTTKKTSTKPNNLENKKNNSKVVKIEEVENKINKIISETSPQEKIDSKNAEKVVIKEDNINKDIKTEQPKFGIFEYILLLIIVSLIFSLIGYFIGLKGNKSVNDDYVTVNKELREFIEEYNYILENYYGNVDESELISSAIKGMLSAVDEYSGFIDEESNNDSISLKGQYEGLGIGLLNDNKGNIVIVTVYENSPASKAGIKVGDIVYKINDEDLTGQDNSIVVDKVAELDDINLVIKRNDEEIKFNLKKENIIINSVTSEMLENNIGYIKVDLFAENTDEQFQEALTKLENQNMQSLIIDLRGNRGGHLSTVKNMLSLFMNDTHIIYQTEDENGIEKVYSTGNKDKDYKIVILQDLSSASASEVMASSLKEQLDAYIIGTNSFGKGTVQTLRKVEGIGEYKVTTMKWLTSNGVWIDTNGITPDLEVELSNEYYQNPTRENDNQFQEALNYLKGEN